MFIKLPSKQCSKCGSTDVEEATRGGTVHVIRCLSCGHEKLTMPSKTEIRPTKWNYDPSKPEVF